jgi:hypothetical protein
MVQTKKITTKKGLIDYHNYQNLTALHIRKIL